MKKNETIMIKKYKYTLEALASIFSGLLLRFLLSKFNLINLFDSNFSNIFSLIVVLFIFITDIVIGYTSIRLNEIQIRFSKIAVKYEKYSNYRGNDKNLKDASLSNEISDMKYLRSSLKKTSYRLFNLINLSLIVIFLEIGATLKGPIFFKSIVSIFFIALIFIFEGAGLLKYIENFFDQG